MVHEDANGEEQVVKLSPIDVKRIWALFALYLLALLGACGTLYVKQAVIENELANIKANTSRSDAQLERIYQHILARDARFDRLPPPPAPN